MNQKNFNDAIIGNKNIKATFSRRGELLRAYYPNVDFKQFIDLFHTGLKINDSAIIYLHDDINNRYFQYYTEDTNILNTEIENKYFNINITQTDFVSIKENLIIKKYVFANNNKINLDLNFIVRSKLLTNANNMFSGKVISNGLIQYSHDNSFCIFSNKKVIGHRINNVEEYIRGAILEDKDYIGMSADSAVSFDLGVLKPGELTELELFIYIKDNKELKKQSDLEEKIEELAKIDVKKEFANTKKYWKNYLEKHDGLKLLNNENVNMNEKALEIYKRSILLFPLLQNEETGGIAAAIEVDENREYSGRYSYCWPRDSIFITEALDELNMSKETEKFYENFCKITQNSSGMWEQRFYTDGKIAPCWGYQIDETASVIYGIYEHYKKTKNQKFLEQNLKMCENAMHFLFKYLENIFNEEKNEEDLVKKEILKEVKEQGREEDKLYKHLSYDLWEMNEGVHLYSLSSIYAALNAMKKIYKCLNTKYENNRLKLEQINKNNSKIDNELENIKNYINLNLVNENTKTLKRNTKDDWTDISLIGVVYPFEVFSIKEKKVQNTVEKINLTLRTYSKGYLRFENDSYMGGKNPWSISTLWMAIYYIKAGEREKAKECLNFIINTSSDLGFLSEQIDNNTMKPNWVIGLAWAHAMYIIVLKLLYNTSSSK